MELKTVFISYATNSSKEYVDMIVDCLESKGIGVWYAPRDVISDYPRDIVEAIGRCRVFLFVLNRYSNKSQHCMNEISIAFERVCNNEPISLLVFKIDDAKPEDDIKYYLQRTHIVDGSLLPKYERVCELCDRVLFLLNRDADRVTGHTASVGRKAPVSSHEYTIQSDCVYPDKKFVGRSGELELIHNSLTGSINKIILTGMGGIGKSELVKKYINCYRKTYDDVIWLDYQSSLERTLADDSKLQIENFSKQNHPEMDMHEYFAAKLNLLKRISTERTLIVVDNLADPDDSYFDEFCGGSYTVIFTSRYKEISESIPEMQITVFDNWDDLRKLFLTEYKRSLSAADKTKVEYMINQVGRHTLCIRLLAGAMQKKRIKPESLETLQTVATYIAHEKLEDMMTKLLGYRDLSEEEEFVLNNLALIPSQGMEVTQFAECCGIGDYDVIDSLIRSSIIVHNPIEDKIHLHPTIRGIFIKKIQDNPASVDGCIKAILKKCRYTHELTYPEKLELYNLIEWINTEIPADYIKKNEITYCMAMMKMDLCLYRDAEDIFLDLLKNVTVPVERVRIWNKLALSAELLGDTEECIRFAKKAKAEIDGYSETELSAEKRSYYLRPLLDRLCESSRAVGKYKESVEYARESVRLCEVLTFNKDRAMGWSLYHLSNALYDLGTEESLAEGEAKISEAIKWFDSVSDHRAILYCNCTLARFLIKRQAMEHVLEMLEEAVTDLKERFGDMHSDVANVEIVLGEYYEQAGDQEKAKEYYQKAAQSYEYNGMKEKLEDAVLKANAIEIY